MPKRSTQLRKAAIYHRLTRCCVLAIALLCSQTNAAQTSAVVFSHDLTIDKPAPAANGGQTARFTITGPDPYLIYQIGGDWLQQASESEQSQRKLIIPLAIESNAQLDQTNISTKLELFFKIESREKNQYDVDSTHRLIYSLPIKRTQASADNNIVLLIPDAIVLAVGDTIRLDIDNCTKCSLVETNPTGNGGAMEGIALNATRVMNGVGALNDSKQSISPKSWRLRDLTGSTQNLTPQTGDAYLVSPHLDLDASSVAGLRLSLDAFRMPATEPINTTKSDGAQEPELVELQVFHSDNLHGFSGNAVTQFKIWIDTQSDLIGDTCRHDVFIPFKHLRLEAPSQELILDQLRIDLPSDLDLGWRLCEATLIPNNLLVDQMQFTPHLMNHAHGRSLGPMALLKGILENLSRDWPFILILVVLLIVTGWRAARLFLTGSL